MKYYREITSDISQVKDDNFYRVTDLMAILKSLGLNFSIYTIRDYETWKCVDYKCGKRHNEEVDKCSRCSGKIRPPLIKSPRTVGGGKGIGHRKYTGTEIKEIVEIFKKRV